MKYTVLLVASGALAVGACATAPPPPTETLGQATLLTKDGVPVGAVELRGNGDRVSLVASMSGVPAGPHGFHLHTTGVCSGPDFKSAGGHLNPLKKHHGQLAENGPHVGDLANLVVPAGATATESYDITGSRRDVMDWIFDDDGTAVVLHAGPDDYRTDPAGNAGPRLACGVLQPS